MRESGIDSVVFGRPEGDWVRSWREKGKLVVRETGIDSVGSTESIPVSRTTSFPFSSQEKAGCERLFVLDAIRRYARD